jgi:ABC-type transport system substrate-binding protein
MKIRDLTLVLMGPAILSLLSCSHQESRSVYRAALRYIPETTNPHTSQINTDNFIALQLYYPLFQHSADGSLTSEFLDLKLTRAADSSFKKFSLCLRDDARFSDGTAIAMSDLQYSLQEAHQRQELLPAVEQIRPSQRCVQVTLKKSDPRYFDKLTGIASTVTSPTRSAGGFPLGLGAYHIASHTPDRLTLEANPGRVLGSFRTIEFHKFTDFSKDYANGVFDFNHTGQVVIPASVEHEFQRVSRPFFKSYAVVVNYPVESLRKRFSACFPAEKLRPLLNLSLKPTEGFLPSGLQGSDSVKTHLASERKESCSPISTSTAMTFLNYRPELNSTLRDFITTVQPTLPVPLHYENGTIDDLVKKMFHDDKVAAVIGFDSSTSNSSAYAEAATFFESFIREHRSERLISQPVHGLAKLVKAAAQATDPSTKAELYRKAHQLLLDSGYVIPLGQFDTAQHYPRWVRNVSWSDQISGFPNIALMEATP